MWSTSELGSPGHASQSPRIRMPVHNLSDEDLRLEQAKHTYQHFHSPYNHHNRFMASVTESDKYFLRDFERVEPYTTRVHKDNSSLQDRRQRPASAPTRAQATGMEAHSPRTPRTPRTPRSPGMASTFSMFAPNGSPCYSVQAKIKADMVEGRPLDGDPSESTIPAWRAATVETYATPPARYGFGSTGTRPFHQDYRHYKYHGFAGKGAKTSWAHNPKFSMISSPLDAVDMSADTSGKPPLEEYIGGPRRELTAAEKQLIKEFRGHSLDATNQKQPASPRKPSSRDATNRHAAASPRPTFVEIAEPMMYEVDIERRQVLQPSTPQPPADDWRHARVMTYRQPVESLYASVDKASPQHGAQAPFVKRYQHYKYHGFAGKGATSSWARNPKHAMLDD